MNDTNTRNHLLAWIDVETTGLNPNNASILEIGVIITDLRATQTLAGFHRVISTDRIDITPGNRKAIDMHMANGLIDECLGTAPMPEPSGPLANDLTDRETTPAKPAMAADDLSDFLEAFTAPYHLHPAGTNPDFDLRFLTTLTIAVRALDYRKLDLTTLRLAALANGADPYHLHPAGTHRVLDCLHRDLDDYRHLLDHLLTNPTAQPHPANEATDCPICATTRKETA